MANKCVNPEIEVKIMLSMRLPDTIAGATAEQPKNTGGGAGKTVANFYLAFE